MCIDGAGESLTIQEMWLLLQKGGLENTEGACWAHILGLPHLDPLLSLCLRFGPLRKVNHRHLAALSFFSFLRGEVNFSAFHQKPG